jgi:hypothetical protein
VSRRRHEATPTGERILAKVDVDPNTFTRLPDGRNVQGHVFGLTEEQVERVRLGYICIKCLEAYDTALPDFCAVCKFPMRKHQGEEFAKTYAGDIKFGPSTSIEEEYAIAEEMIQREAYDKARSLGLILPKYM